MQSELYVQSMSGELDELMAMLPESPIVRKFGCGGQGRWRIATGKRMESVGVNGQLDFEMLSLVRLPR
jgi:hypothetical protein